MKRTMGIILIVLTAFIITGCNQEERAELQAVIQREVEEEEVYTPETYRAYEEAIEDAEAIKEEAFASMEELTAAMEALEEAIDALCRRADKAELAAVIEKADGVNEETYTTVSYEAYRDAILSASEVMSDENASQDQVDRATNNLELKKKGLIVAKDGVYRLDYDFELVYNNSVGNEWDHFVTYKGEVVYDGEEIAAPLGSTITITGKIIEDESIPDYGSGSLTLELDGGSKSKRIIVRENAGRYTGNTATWELTASATLLKRK